ncbi:hypothetical protein ACHRVK_11580 [Flavobacterium plurextorum]|uniref:hypothetical protein n=1 Tax=Flavobacterium plurextorum TaxID=1114867 RepID=UPI0037564920
MKVHSKFRPLYLIRKNSLFLFTCFCFLIFYDKVVSGVYETIILFFLFFTVSIFFQVINLRTINEIIVSEEGITKINFLTKKANFIPYSLVANLDTMRVQGMSGKAGQITSGYFESMVILKDGKKILISPDSFENYQEIIASIRSHVLN